MSKKIKIFELANRTGVGSNTLIETINKLGLATDAKSNTRIDLPMAEALFRELRQKIDSNIIEDIRQELRETSADGGVQESKPAEQAPKENTATSASEPKAKGGLKIVGHIEEGRGKASKKATPTSPEKSSKPQVETPQATPTKVAPSKSQETKAVTPTPVAKAKEVEAKPAPQPKKEEVAIAPEASKEPSVPTPAIESKEEQRPETHISNVGHAQTQGLNILGTLDLSSLPGSNRPSKKSPKGKERDKDKSSGSVATPGGSKDTKKRARIGGTPVDPNAVGKSLSESQPKQKKNAPSARGEHPARGNGKDSNYSSKESRDSRESRDLRERGGRDNKKSKSISQQDIQDNIRKTNNRISGSTGKGGRADRKARLQAQAIKDEEAALNDNSMELRLTEFVTVSDLASLMDVPVGKVIGTCMSIGLMVSINMRLDAETIELVAGEFGFTTNFVSADIIEDKVEEEDREEDLVTRPPIVTVMGHVDHGKTSLLDRLRDTNVIAGEAGGITQHIGAYSLTLENGKCITFLDTPGHEAFTAMRARGAKITDIAIIIVAADDDVMPQTKEAINHAAAAGVPMIFAINKIDKPGANPDRIREQLANMNYLVEDWGGKYQCQEISAKHGLNINELLEKVLLEAELLELKANPSKRATGSVIESSLDKGRGYVATVMVQNGTLSTGDVLLSGTHFGKVKAMFNERNQRVESAGPSTPVLVLGLDGAPGAGELFNVMETEQEARSIASKREQLKREQDSRTKKGLTLDELARRRALGNFQELNVIIKGDVDGSVEALGDSLIRLSTEEIQVNVIHKGVGAISENDVALAAASSAIIIGFQVRPSQAAKRQADREGVEIRTYSIIYDTIEDIKSAMEGMLSPEIKETVVANLEVRETFKITKLGTVAGCMVIEGKIKRNNKIRLIRDGIVKYAGALGSLKRFKDDAKEVVMGQDCGLNIDGYNDIMVGDIIEAYEETEIKKTLDS